MKKIGTSLLTGTMLLLLAPGNGAAQAPPVTLRLGPVDGKAVPAKHCCSNTGGGNFEVRQTAPDTVVITMAGAAVAGLLCGSPAQFDFDLVQNFTVVYEKPEVKGAMLYMQGRVVGLLRSPGKGEAGFNNAHAAVAVEGKDGSIEILAVHVPDQAVSCKDNLSVYRKEGPLCVAVAPGCYTLHQTFSIWARGGLKNSSAEFGPGVINPAWISYKEPFYGAAKKDFGFQVIFKVVPVGTVPATLGKADPVEAKTTVAVE